MAATATVTVSVAATETVTASTEVAAVATASAEVVKTVTATATSRMAIAIARSAANSPIFRKWINSYKKSAAELRRSFYSFKFQVSRFKYLKPET